jgi:hypothetical protein
VLHITKNAARRLFAEPRPQSPCHAAPSLALPSQAEPRHAGTCLAMPSRALPGRDPSTLPQCQQASNRNFWDSL